LTLYYFRMKVKIALTILLSLVVLIGCSHNKVNNSTPNQPPVPQGGRVSILNNSDVSIRIAGYTQQRGSQIQQVQLWVHIFPNQDFILHNIIDPGQSQIFPGGDKLTVVYISEERDPNNPGQPLFQQTVVLTVDGNLLIHVKNGGLYGIMPG
jgi:hypothetical protein